MPCSRGQANPDRITTLRLFAASGGYCQRPECPNPLFVDTGSKCVHLAEIAHIIAAGKNGPRADAMMTSIDKCSYENLILLCANCHAIIDKAPTDFTDDKIQEWKRKHAERIAHLFGAIECSDRASARKAFQGALVENRTVFDQYGPANDYRQNPESDFANSWQRKVREIILPNNRKILAILDANLRHLVEAERMTLELFRQHVDDLEVKHIGVYDGSIAIRFPEKMHDMLS